VHDAHNSSTRSNSTNNSSEFGKQVQQVYVKQEAAASGLGPVAPDAFAVAAVPVATTDNSQSSLQERNYADPASPQAVKSMSGDEILHRWRGLLRELGAALVAAQEAAGARVEARGMTSSSACGGPGVTTAMGSGSSNNSSSSAFERLEELTARSKQLLGTALVLNPGEDATNLSTAVCLGLQEAMSPLLCVQVHVCEEECRTACEHCVVKCDMELAALLWVWLLVQLHWSASQCCLACCTCC
jgi:hypothetical protein